MQINKSQTEFITPKRTVSYPILETSEYRVRFPNSLEELESTNELFTYCQMQTVPKQLYQPKEMTIRKLIKEGTVIDFLYNRRLLVEEKATGKICAGVYLKSLTDKL